MYLQYWELKKFPFENVTDPYFFYLSENHEEALSRLLYAAKMRKGGAMLTGDTGCGETLIIEQVNPRLCRGTQKGLTV